MPLAIDIGIVLIWMSQLLPSQQESTRRDRYVPHDAALFYHPISGNKISQSESPITRNN
jgi:hypothetical protein